jgi:hypothetical protein
MRIDWAETLIGVNGSDDDPAAGLRADLVAARLAGILAASLAIGLAIALFPARGALATRLDVLALAGVFIANIGAFLMLGRAFRPGLQPMTCLPLLALPFALMAGVDLPILAALGVISMLDIAVSLEARGRRIRLAAAGLGGLVAIAAFAGAPSPGAAGLMIAALAPLVWLAISAFAPRASQDRRADDGIAHQALLGIALRDARRHLVLTDIVGTIETRSEAGFGTALAGAVFPEGSIVSATLIADRVALLNALSRAIHNGESVEALELRLRLEPAGAGYPSPPRYVAHRVSIYPVARGDARAILAFEPAVEDERPLVQDVATTTDSATLARVLHDCNAPFNAGLGFLEMIADPRLAPRDIATYREFAAESHKAVTDAYRNTVLLGRWLKLSENRAAHLRESAEAVPQRLVNDAVRALNLRDAEDRGELRISVEEGLPLAQLPVGLARFALEVLLRGALGMAPARITVSREGADLVVACRAVAGHRPPAEDDAFQNAIETAVSGEGALIAFASAGPDERTLRFTGAFAAAMSADPADHAPAPQPARLASRRLASRRLAS